jgi:hypothetical protein
MKHQCFETCHTFNWASANQDQPVLVLNDAAPQINRIGFAWGIAANLALITDLLLQGDADDLVILTSYVNGQAQILAAILDKLGDEVQAAGGAK